MVFILWEEHHMSLIFRKTLTLGKLLRVNIGKNGPSLSVGPRGASVSIGKSGTYVNAGISGSGMRVRQKLNSSAVKKSANDIKDTASNKKQIMWIIGGIILAIFVSALKNK